MYFLGSLINVKRGKGRSTLQWKELQTEKIESRFSQGRSDGTLDFKSVVVFSDTSVHLFLVGMRCGSSSGFLLRVSVKKESFFLFIVHRIPEHLEPAGRWNISKHRGRIPRNSLHSMKKSSHWSWHTCRCVILVVLSFVGSRVVRVIRQGTLDLHPWKREEPGSKLPSSTEEEFFNLFLGRRAWVYLGYVFASTLQSVSLPWVDPDFQRHDLTERVPS